MFGKPKYTIVKIAKKKDIPEGLWTKCEECGDIVYNKALEENMKVCPKCNYHFVLTAPERIAALLDAGSFEERDSGLRPIDPLLFKGPKSYEEKLKEDQELTGLSEACISGRGAIEGKRVIFVVTDSRFIMGSMGSVVGEKIARATELATNLRLPLVIVSGSGGGARMYEGLFSLMQMAKTSAAIAKLHEAGVPYISVLTNPTMAGVMASFASLGDIIMAEPKALIGFTGPRVIEQTIRQKLPPGFQRSEFLLEHGLLDMIIHRKNLKSSVAQVIDYLT
ncbi:MAG: acetyl-CoA carboxylase subunit beta [Omnitrophica WOR_2 bacterium RIFCSPLOWO2_12_FULL_51_24]|nr:MAG: acetyl-CoA carboxylase subunit beta [Omnitrophica WOR_2 bacterium RIFCSPLOWO2_02_FULL_50_19]OGX41779.1 MAG: acetyl-CoA carboxylase subunit beta [Omnitrophica WOR_2 bacterium RIFCSPLOWO2_12_FULL_51_24]